MMDTKTNIPNNTEMTPVISLKGVNKWYGDFQALSNIDLEIKLKEKIVICGPSGSGKSTLIRCLNRLEAHQEGTIHVSGIELHERMKDIDVVRQDIGMVFQSFNLFPHLTVLENCMAGPNWVRGVDKSKAKERAIAMLEQVKIPEQADKYPEQLSGGQQQRVALARSLAKKATILLLDEPLVNLDYKLREDLRNEFKNIFSDDLSSQSILIYASTDPMEAMQLNGNIVVIDEGKILQHDTAKEVFENPTNIKVAEITNEPAMNIVNGYIESKKIILNQNVQIDLPDKLKTIRAGKYFFGLRASDIVLDDSGFPFVVDLAEISGSETILHLHQDNLKFVSLINEVKNFNNRDKVKVKLMSENLYVFNKKGNLIISPFKYK